MPIQIRKAERRKSKLRLGLAGPSGAGKTMSALKLAQGLGGKVCMIDTERGSGDLYAHLFEYDIITLAPPFAPKNYTEAITAAENAGYDIIIIDSLSHAWADEGGILDQLDKKDAKNSYTAWADLTPQHRLLVNAMLNSPSHIIATVRSKQAYELEEYVDKQGNKKTKPVKMGLAPVQREGMEYEFTVFMDIGMNHAAQTSKDRTDMFKDEVFVIDEKVGKRLMDWLNEGKVDMNALKAEVLRNLKRLELDMPTDSADKREFVAEAVEKLTELHWSEENIVEIVAKLKEWQDKELAYKAVWGEPDEPKDPDQEFMDELDDIPFDGPPEEPAPKSPKKKAPSKATAKPKKS